MPTQPTFQCHSKVQVNELENKRKLSMFTVTSILIEEWDVSAIFMENLKKPNHLNEPVSTLLVWMQCAHVTGSLPSETRTVSVNQMLPP